MSTDCSCVRNCDGYGGRNGDGYGGRNGDGYGGRNGALSAVMAVGLVAEWSLLRD